MVHVEEAFEAFQANGLRFFTGVPDSLLKDFCAYVTDHTTTDQHIIAANEGSAVGLAIGHYIASGSPALVYLQNSGLGNTVNPLLSLADPEIYAIPMVLMLGWRGEPGVNDEPQHRKQGRVMIQMLEAMEYPYRTLDPQTEWAANVISDCCRLAREHEGPVMLVVRQGTFHEYRLKRDDRQELSLTREAAIELVLHRLGSDTVVVGTTGKASREVYELRAASGGSHERDFLTVGGMGHASMIALGIALRSPDRRVVCLDGDGAALMHLGAMSTIGTAAPENFYHVLLNNGAHDSVGGQPTVALDIDLPGVARASGYLWAERATAADQVVSGLDRLLEIGGPGLLEVTVRKGARSDLGRPRTTPVENRDALMAWLRAEATTG